MTRFLLLISILFASVANLFASASEQELIPPDTLFRFENSERVEYNFSLQFKNNTFTGVCVMKLMGQEIRGSIMNEFGVKAFDFVYELLILSSTSRCTLIGTIILFLYNSSSGIIFDQKRDTSTSDRLFNKLDVSRKILYSLAHFCNNALDF